jgi:putative ABC transport system permease protein
MIKNYFKIAWRNLLRHKRMSFINIAELSIGMAASILIVLWVQNELSFDNYHADVNNIYLIRNVYSSGNETNISERTQYVLGEDAAKEIPEADVVTRMTPRPEYIHYNGNIIAEKDAAFVDDKWFDVFHYDVVEGTIDPFKTNPFSLIVTETTAKRYFGRDEAVGKMMRIDSNVYQVQAVVKDNPANSTFRYNMLIPVASILTDARTKKRHLQWGNSNYITFVKLKPAAIAKTVEAKLGQIFRENVKIGNSITSYNLLPVKGLHFEKDASFSSFQHGSKSMVGIFIVLGSLILITACINYVNFTTARASIRSKEVGIRKIVGAGRLSLFGQFMSESLLISFVSVLLAVMLVQASMPWYRNFTGKDFADPMSSSLVWLIMAGTLVVSFMLNGLYPALLLSSFKPMNVFRGNSVLNFRDAGLRKSLVIVQFTISVILTTGTLVIYRQLRYVENIDLGYDKAQVFMVDLPYKAFKNVDSKDMSAKLNTVKQELRSQNSIADVAVSNGELVDFGNSSGLGAFDWSGKPKDLDFQVMRLETDADFQRTMRIRIKEGRWFNNAKNDVHNAVINETAVKQFGLDKKSPIGMRFVHTGDTGVIVGVVKDFHYASLHDKIGPLVISNNQEEALQVSVRTYPHSTQQAIAAAQRIVYNLAPDEPFVYSFLDDDYNNLYRTEQQSSVLIALFAGIAIVVSALGLLGLAAFAAEQRVKEIGIRKVLGATVKDIVKMLSSSFIRMVLIASLAAFPIAWWAMNKWLQGFAYKIALSWWIFVIAAGVALVIALLTVSAQAIKAAMANPVKSLRSE